MSDSAVESWWFPFRKVGAVNISQIDLTPHVTSEASALLWLDEEERERSNQFVHTGARRRFILCRAALRSILCANLRCSNAGLSFGELQHGKPYALVDGETAPISFNVSHSGRHGLIAVAPAGNLGVDIEERTIRRDFDRLIGAAFGRNEQPELLVERARGECQLFFKLWTVKEALIKALGTGLSLDPSEFEAPAEIRKGAVTSIFRFPQHPAIVWKVEDLGNEQFAAALAYDV